MKGLNHYTGIEPGTPMRLGGDLRLKAYFFFAIALVLPFLTYRCGPGMMHRILSRRQIPDADVVSQILLSVLAVSYALLGIIAGLVILKLRRESRSCITLEQAAEQFSVDVEQLQTKVAAEKVKIRFIVDGKPVYALGDLSQAGLLVRASQPPNAADELVRPAGQPAGEEETLLHIVVSERL